MGVRGGEETGACKDKWEGGPGDVVVTAHWIELRNLVLNETTMEAVGPVSAGHIW